MNIVRMLKDWLAPEAPDVRQGQTAAHQAVSDARETISREEHLVDVRLRMLQGLAETTRLRDPDG